MSDTRQTAMRIAAAFEFVGEHDDEDVRPHYLDQVCQLHRDIKPDDLTTAELASLVVILAPAHSRVLAARERRCCPLAGPVTLRLVPFSETSA